MSQMLPRKKIIYNYIYGFYKYSKQQICVLFSLDIINLEFGNSISDTRYIKIEVMIAFNLLTTYDKKKKRCFYWLFE